MKQLLTNFLLVPAIYLWKLKEKGQFKKTFLLSSNLLLPPHFLHRFQVRALTGKLQAILLLPGRRRMLIR